MIAKHVSINSAQKSDFAGLIRYLVGPQSKQERVGQVRVTNCHSEQAEIAMVEVLNTQAQNTRSAGDKTYHLVVSFADGEAPDDRTLEAIEARLCAGLGFAEHQRVSVVHHDTDNLHFHIAINKIHPSRYTIHEPYNAYHTIGRLCEKMEIDYGLQRTNHKASKSGGENRATDMEKHAAIESLIGWIKRECAHHIRGASSWGELHQVLLEHGLHIHERANGLVITSDAAVSAKASSIGREFSKARLEARLGKFEPSVNRPTSETAAKRYRQGAMSSHIDTSDLYASYRSEQLSVVANRTAEWNKAIAIKKRLTEEAKRNGRLKRAAIKLLVGPRAGKKLMYAMASKTLLEEIDEINRHYIRDKQEIYQTFKRQAWADWLRIQASKGNDAALAVLRSRNNKGAANAKAGAANSSARANANVKQDSVTKRGTVIYCVGQSAIRDDGDRLKISHGADAVAVAAALRLATERYGGRLDVSGSETFKEMIAHAAVANHIAVHFHDHALERRRQQLSHLLRNKENSHANDNIVVGRRLDRGSDRSSGKSAAKRPGSDRSTRGIRNSQPDAGKARKGPPPEARHAVRELPQLGMVQLANRPEMLLPGDVPGHMERQGAQPDHSVRRGLRGTERLKSAETHREQIRGREQKDPASTELIKASQPTDKATEYTPPPIGKVGMSPPPASRDRLRRLSQLGLIAIDAAADSSQAAQSSSARTEPAGAISNGNFNRKEQSPSDAAAEQYVFEREQKRSKGFDIPKHKRFTFTHDELASFAGSRVVNGQTLGLFKVGDEIAVIPVDDATARRLQHFRIGRAVIVSAKGAIRTRGRSR